MWSHRRDEKRGRHDAPPALVVSGFGSEALNLGLTGADVGSSSWPSVLQEIALRLGFGASPRAHGSVFKPRAPPSGANPAALLGQPQLKVTSEDEVLSVDSAALLDMQRSVDADGSPLTLATAMLQAGADERPPLSARDAELLLSYLTAPYLRIPLMLQFFADQQRLNALAHPRMQEVLEAALFEPGAWQEEPRRRPPTHVPLAQSERATVLATPLGLLFNELVHSPTLLLDPLERLLDMALDLDTVGPGSHGYRHVSTFTFLSPFLCVCAGYARRAVCSHSILHHAADRACRIVCACADQPLRVEPGREQSPARSNACQCWSLAHEEWLR